MSLLPASPHLSSHRPLEPNEKAVDPHHGQRVAVERIVPPALELVPAQELLDFLGEIAPQVAPLSVTRVGSSPRPRRTLPAEPANVARSISTEAPELQCSEPRPLSTEA